MISDLCSKMTSFFSGYFSWIARRHILLVFCFNVLAGIFFFCVPLRNLGYSFDDYVLLANAKIDSLQDFVSQFSTDARDWFETESLDWWFFRSEKRVNSALNAQYRPLAYIPMAIFEKFFHNAFFSYFFSVFLHIINSVFVFYILSLFFKPTLSFLGSLYFLFHSSIAWITVIATMHDVQQLLLLFIMIFFYKQYLAKEEKRFFVASCFMFFLVLLTKEVCIFVPLLIFLFHVFFNFSDINLSFKNLIFSFKRSLPFFAVSIGLVLLRFFLFGWVSHGSHLYTSSLIRHGFKARIWSYSHNIKILLGTLFLDNLNPRLIPWMLLPCAIIGIIFFLKTIKKREVLFLIICIFFLSWPSWIWAIPGPRYLYVSLPFFILMIMFLAYYAFKNSRQGFLFLLLFFLVSLAYSLSTLRPELKKAEKITQEFSVLASQLSGLIKNLKKTDFFILLAPPNTLPWEEVVRVVLDEKFRFGEITKLPLEMFEWSDYERAKLEVFSENGGFRIRSLSSQILHVSLACRGFAGDVIADTEKRLTDRFVIHGSDKNGVIFDYSIFFKKGHSFFEKSVKYIAWDNKEKVFYVVA